MLVGIAIGLGLAFVFAIACLFLVGLNPRGADSVFTFYLVSLIVMVLCLLLWHWIGPHIHWV